MVNWNFIRRKGEQSRDNIDKTVASNYPELVQDTNPQIPKPTNHKQEK